MYACMVADYVAWSNWQDGIRCSQGGVIHGNCCESNGFSSGIGAGIHVTGKRTHIEGNNCSSADFGVRVIDFGNILVRDTCSNDTVNWDIVEGNKCLVVIAASSGAISGDSGGHALGVADPHVNFTF